MSKFAKLKKRLRDKSRSNNWTYDELHQIMIRIGYVGKSNGSSHVTYRKKNAQMVTLKKIDGTMKARPYVELVRDALEASEACQ